MSQRWLNLLGLARRAGHLAAGTETVSVAIQKGRAMLAVAAADLSAGTRERLARLTGSHHVDLIVDSSRSELGSITGCPGRGVYAVTDREFAKAIWSSWTANRQAGTAEGGVPHS